MFQDRPEVQERINKLDRIFNKYGLGLEYIMDIDRKIDNFKKKRYYTSTANNE
jgi:hypothetical protein